MPVDGRLRRGAATRRVVLERAAGIASVEGLEGLSIGRLATELELSKSGVFALFGSKEELQLAAVRFAQEVFADNVLRPARAAAPGLARLRTLCESWLGYSRRRVFPGGCFFFNTAAEFDARPGRVHDAIAEADTVFRDFVHTCAQEAVTLGELTADADLLTFELLALGHAANADSVLHGGTTPYDMARACMLNRLAAVAG